MKILFILCVTFFYGHSAFSFPPFEPPENKPSQPLQHSYTTEQESLQKEEEDEKTSPPLYTLMWTLFKDWMNSDDCKSVVDGILSVDSAERRKVIIAVAPLLELEGVVPYDIIGAVYSLPADIMVQRAQEAAQKARAEEDKEEWTNIILSFLCKQLK